MKGYKIEAYRFGIRAGGAAVTQRMIDEHGGTYAEARAWLNKQRASRATVVQMVIPDRTA